MAAHASGRHVHLPALPALLLALLVLVATTRSSADPAPNLERALELARQDGRPADFPAAALRELVNESAGQGGPRASTWAYLDYWLAAEWEQEADLPRRREAFRAAWPASRFQESADWLLARWRLRHGEDAAAASCLLPLAAAARDGELRGKAGRLLEKLCGTDLTEGELDSLRVDARAPGRAWLDAWRRRQHLYGRILLVAPLSGPDEAIGQACKAGAEAALRQHSRAGGGRLELLVADCQSDPLVARECLARSADQEVDALLLPGEAAYLAAAAGLETGHPIVVPGHAGPALETLSADLLQFGLDAGAVGSLLAGLARDSLHATHLLCLAPVTRAAKRTVAALHSGLTAAGGVEIGPEQWYFGGARDVEPQLQTLQRFAAGVSGPGAWVVLGAEREAPALRALLAAVPAGDWVLGDLGLLVALGDQVPAALAGRLLIVTDWLPPARTDLLSQAGAADPPGWTAFEQALRSREGRPPTPTETRAFESVRLLALGWDQAERRRRGLGTVLPALETTSLYGGRLRMAGQRAEAGLLLGWNGSGYQTLGRRACPLGLNTERK